MTTQRSYHHGDLRHALLTAAVEAITDAGPAALSLRDLARRAGVSHAAPAHHFGDKAGLLTALATQGHELLAESLVQVLDRTGSVLEVGVAYVRFAVDHRAHFEVMFRPGLYDAADPELAAAEAKSAAALEAALATMPDVPTGDEGLTAGLAAWSIVHGFAVLWLAGAFPEELGEDPEVGARNVIRLLYA
jgi:AcrR family transcriptional regulator